MQASFWYAKMKKIIILLSRISGLIRLGTPSVICGKQGWVDVRHLFRKHNKLYLQFLSFNIEMGPVDEISDNV